MKDDTVKKAKKILGTSQSEEIQAKVSKVEKIDPIEETKYRILRFLQDAFSRVEEDNLLKRLVAEKIQQKIEDPDEDLSLSQLVGLYESVVSGITSQTAVLTSVVKPAPNTHNPLLERSNTQEADMNKAFESVSSKEMQTIASLDEKMKKILAMQNLNSQDDE